MGCRAGSRAGARARVSTARSSTKPRTWTLADVEAYCDERPNSVSSYPFGPSPLVYKIGGKIFALLGNRSGHDSVSLKCDPERTPMLRSSYPAITPGYHLNKTHWNTLVLDGSLPPSLIKQLIDHSHEIVAASAPRKRRANKKLHRPRTRS